MKRYTLRPDQIKIREQLITSLETEQQTVLAATIGFGKTVTAWDIINERADKGERILVLAHGRKELRTNFMTSIARNGHTFELRNSKDAEESNNHRVVITLPQTIKNVTELMDYVDLVVVDEAHQYYSKPMVQKILDEFNRPPVLLLTATHYELKEDVNKIFVSRETALGNKVIENANCLLHKTSWNPKDEDYTQDGDLKTKVNIDKERLKEFSAYVDRSEKTVIICHNIMAAEYVHHVLKEKWGNAVVISHSKNDNDCLLVERFKRQEEIRTLIVVNRASIGFDCPQLEVVVDMTFSKNIMRIEQMFGRVIRKHEGLGKIFVKLCPPSDGYKVFRIIMCGVMALSEDNLYRTWDGKQGNLKILDPDKVFTHRKNSGKGKNKNSVASLRAGCEEATFGQYMAMFKKIDDVAEFTTVARAIAAVKQLSFDEVESIVKKKKWGSLQEWSIEDPDLYQHARYRGWHRAIAERLGLKIQRIRLNFSLEEVEGLVKKAGWRSTAEWSKEHPALYQYAAGKKKDGKRWHRIVAERLGLYIKTTKEKNPALGEVQAIVEARGYTSTDEWRDDDVALYRYAMLQKKDGQTWVRVIAERLGLEMRRPRITSVEELQAIVEEKGYSSTAEWRKDDPNLYACGNTKKEGGKTWVRIIAERLGMKIQLQ